MGAEKGPRGVCSGAFGLCLFGLILGVLLYFIYKNRKERIRLAEKAMESGQAIPDNLLPEKVPTPDSVWQKGIRQLCLGVGLMVFLGYTAGEIGFGVGVHRLGQHPYCQALTE